MQDSVVGLLALDAKERGLLDETSIDDTWWSSQMNQDALLGDHWLLAYEADVKGWVTKPKQKGYTELNNAFKFLADKSVSFYEESYDHDDVVTHYEVSSDASDDDTEEEDDDEEEEEYA